MNTKNARTQNAGTRDDTLIEKIQSRIRWDIRVSNSDISMRVNKGRVKLFGYFDKPYRHAAALNVITTTDGVTLCDDQSVVLTDYYRTDRELEALIAKQILALQFLPGEWMDAQVCDGIAKLEGQVFRPRYKAFASRATWELSGIQDCINLIEIRKSPEVIRKAQPAFHIAPAKMGLFAATGRATLAR